jgi:hypothetical protein
LLFSTLPSQQLTEKAQASGAHGFIRKTDDTRELVRHVIRWLRPRSRAMSAGSMPASGRSPSRPPASGQRQANVPTTRDVRVSRPPPRTSGTSRIPPTVLFIDEDMEALSAFQRDVQGEPYRADFALSVAQARRTISSPSAPDLVVSILKSSGVDLYKEAVEGSRTWSDRFIFVAPRKVDDGAATFMREFSGTMLHWPVAGQTLRDSIRRLLGESDRQVERGRGPR